MLLQEIHASIIKSKCGISLAYYYVCVQSLEYRNLAHKVVPTVVLKWDSIQSNHQIDTAVQVNSFHTIVVTDVGSDENRDYSEAFDE